MSTDPAAVIAGIPLPDDSTKYTRGLVVVVAGSRDYPGAGVLCVAGARRGGAGYVMHVSSDDATRMLVLQRFPDVVSRGTAADIPVAHARAYVVGSGRDHAEPSLESDVLAALASDVPVVLDGGALDVVAQSALVQAAVRARRAAVVVTPHVGEARRMAAAIGVGAGDEPNASDAADARARTALTLATSLGVVCVLKGRGSVVATPDAVVWVDGGAAGGQQPAAGPELATAGTGDVLAGLMGSMLAACGADDRAGCADVAAAAVFAHARAGQAAAQRVFSVTALDVAEALGPVMRGLRG